MTDFPLLGLSGPLGFVVVWLGISRLLALFGWQRLAAAYRVPELPAGSRRALAWSSLGLISYRNVIRAGTSAQGLALSVVFPFRVGHPPVLIPWPAVGPVQHRKILWTNTYSIAIQTSESDSVTLKFSDDAFLAMLRPWLLTP